MERHRLGGVLPFHSMELCKDKLRFVVRTELADFTFNGFFDCITAWYDECTWIVSIWFSCKHFTNHSCKSDLVLCVYVDFGSTQGNGFVDVVL